MSVCPECGYAKLECPKCGYEYDEERINKRIRRMINNQDKELDLRISRLPELLKQLRRQTKKAEEKMVGGFL